MENINLVGAIEAMLFAWTEPISIKKLAEIFDRDYEVIKEKVNALRMQLGDRDSGIQLIEINNSVQLVSNPKYGEYIEMLSKTSKYRGLSPSSYEILAIIAYKQPITKQEIESIRGVKSDKLISNLLESDLIKVTGRLERIGRPVIYGTTDLFLKKFGFKSLKDLPSIDALNELQMSIFSEENITDDDINEQNEIEIHNETLDIEE